MSVCAVYRRANKDLSVCAVYRRAILLEARFQEKRIEIKKNVRKEREFVTTERK